MAEELAFARKASGLVRGLSMWDAFAVGFMNQGLTPSIWVTISLGVGVFLGGNLTVIAGATVSGPGAVTGFDDVYGSAFGVKLGAPSPVNAYGILLVESGGLASGAHGLTSRDADGLNGRSTDGFGNQRADSGDDSFADRFADGWPTSSPRRRRACCRTLPVTLCGQRKARRS